VVAGDELTVGVADGDVTAVGAAVGVALADGVAGTDMDGATVGEVLGVDLAGAELAGEVTGAGAACPECAPGDWCAEAARAMPPAADAASSPMTSDAIVSGRASRRRRREACRPGPPGAGGETGDSGTVNRLLTFRATVTSRRKRARNSGSVATMARITFTATS
jgi:hypothetical protein